MKRRHCSKCGQAGHYKSTCKRKGKKVSTKRKGKKVSTKPKPLQRDFPVTPVVLHHGGKTGKTKHDKVWMIGLLPNHRVMVRWGKRLGPKQSKTYKFASKAAEEAFARKLIRSKLAKGYRHLSSSGTF